MSTLVLHLGNNVLTRFGLITIARLQPDSIPPSFKMVVLHVDRIQSISLPMFYGTVKRGMLSPPAIYLTVISISNYKEAKNWEFCQYRFSLSQNRFPLFGILI